MLVHSRTLQRQDNTHVLKLASAVRILAVVMLLEAACGLSAADLVLEENVAVDDVESAFALLRRQGEWLAAWPASGMPESGAPGEGTDKHYQSIQRAPFHASHDSRILYVTRSGRVHDPYDLGFLAVVHLGSRDRTGERFRSNLLRKDVESSSTIPLNEDRVVNVIFFEDYQHPGGTQMVGDILAVPLEGPANIYLPPGKIRFYNCSDPVKPVPLSYEMDFDYYVGVVAITKLPDDHFLLLVTGGDNTTVEYFRSSKTSFLDPEFEFEPHSTWTAAQQPDLYWPPTLLPPTPSGSAFQSLNFINQTDGRLYLMACHNTDPWAPITNGADMIYLFEVFGFEAEGAITLAQTGSALHVDLKASDEPFQDERFGNFNAGGGVYVSPTGELLYYGIYHFDVPDWGGYARLRMSELRHTAVSRHGAVGPQLRPNHLGGPYVIREGETLELNGTVYVVEPWVDMYQDHYFGGRAEMIDYVDQDEEDYQDFSKLDGAGLGGKNGFGDEMTSFVWCASPDYRLEIYKDTWFTGGWIERIGQGYTDPVIHVGDWFNDEASSARIVRIGNPAEPDYAWDIDGDGVLAEFPGGSMAVFGPAEAPSTTTVSMLYGDVVVSTTVSVVQLGDVNLDGRVDAIDVQLVINEALGIETVFDCDVNEDGTVDALDVQLCINAALGMEI